MPHSSSPRRSLRILPALFAGLLLCQSLAAAPEADNRPLKMGFFPIISAIALFKRFAPLDSYLGKELQREIVMETARDFPTFVKRTAQRQYDIVVTAPHFALLAADSGQYRVVASLRKDLVGYIVVRADSPIRDVTELAGKRIATPPRPAIITQSGMDYLNRQLSPPATFLPHKSHNAAYQAVLGGDADAAVVSVNAVNNALRKGLPLRRIGSTPPLPNMAVLVATDLPPAVGQRLQQALVGMDKTPEGRAVLKSIGFPGFRAADNADYEPTRPYLARIGFLKTDARTP